MKRKPFKWKLIRVRAVHKRAVKRVGDLTLHRRLFGFKRPGSLIVSPRKSDGQDCDHSWRHLL